MKQINWLWKKEILVLFLFFLCTARLFGAQDYLLSLIGEKTINFSEIKRLVTWITHSMNGIIMDISEDKKNFKSQDYYKNKHLPHKEIYNIKDVYVYTCPSTKERAIRKIVAIKNEESFRDCGHHNISFLMFGELEPIKGHEMTTITITFDGNKVACSPEEFIKGFGLQNQRLKSNGSLELPKQGSNNRISVRCTFHSNTLSELQFHAEERLGRLEKIRTLFSFAER